MTKRVYLKIKEILCKSKRYDTPVIVDKRSLRI
jgi:hypothetical protein